jgi:hypothetical protein
VLATESFADQRAEVDQLFAKRATYGGLGYTDQGKVREVLDNMLDQLKEQMASIPPQAYVTSKQFLRSLTYAATKGDL